MRRLLIAAVLAVCAASPALAWGELGHRTVAEVAARNLSARASEAVVRLLGGGTERFVGVAGWADQYRDENADTYPWHVVEIPPDADGYERARDCRNDDCIVEKIKEFTRTLADANSTPAARALALRFVIHFVGDIHMPLHAFAPLNHPRGTWIRIGGTVDALHLWWDNEFVDALGPNEGALADMLEDRFPFERRQSWTQGTSEDWANESFAIARAFVQKHDIIAAVRANAASSETPMELPLSVIGDVKPIVAERLYVAGLRLARVLNDALE